MRRISVLLATAIAAVTVAAGAHADPGGYAHGEPAAAGQGPSAGTLLSRRGELLGRALAFKGRLDAAHAGRPVALQRLEPDGTWTDVARTVAATDGTFRVEWVTDHIGRFTLRAVPRPEAGSAATANPTDSRAVTVYRPATATFYGPGLYGRRTACGQRLTRKLRGIAHRTLRCGTRVDVLYRGRRVTVPVVDRGPFGETATWDLTAATARDLRFEHTDTIGAVRVRDRPTPPPAGAAVSR